MQKVFKNRVPAPPRLAPLQAIRKGRCEDVATLVIFVARVAVHPDERDLMALELGYQLLPEVDVKHLGAICLAPAVLAPGIEPAAAYGVNELF